MSTIAGEAIEIGFNVRYLLDALGSLTEDEVALELGGQLDPGVIKPVGTDRLHRRDHADADLS